MLGDNVVWVLGAGLIRLWGVQCAGLGFSELACAARYGSGVRQIHRSFSPVRYTLTLQNHV